VREQLRVSQRLQYASDNQSQANEEMRNDDMLCPRCGQIMQKLKRILDHATNHLDFPPAYLLLNEQKGCGVDNLIPFVHTRLPAYESLFTVCLFCFRLVICYNSFRFSIVLKGFHK
jgi:hypothetical protein